MPIKNLEKSSEDETDALSVSDVRAQPINPRTQPSAKRGFFFTSKPKLAKKTVILIPHAYQTDREAGDYFGATLYTYTLPWGNTKYQHLLKKIKDGYPAQKMRICKGDELVLIGQTSTPDLNHTEVLNSFHHDVTVDGKTRFCLVLRKREKKSLWYWYQTSAILSPDRKQHFQNEVKGPKIGLAKTRRDSQKIVVSIYDSSLYMFIDQSGIHGVPIERLDKPIYVNMTVEISFNQNVAPKAALFGMDGTSYVSLYARTDGQRDIRISGESTCTWFGYKKKGSDHTFYVDDCFLSYDKIEKKFVMCKIKEGRNCVTFVDVGDHPDCACASELAKMDAEETDDTDSGYARNGSQEKDTWTPDDPICLSTDNLDMD